MRSRVKFVFSELITYSQDGTRHTWYINEVPLSEAGTANDFADFEEFYINDISIRDKIEEKLNIGVGRIEGRIEKVDNGTYLQLKR